MTRPVSRTAAAASAPLHTRAAAVVLVAAGGVFGAAAREAVEQAWPAGRRALPVATLAINLGGALVLGLLLEALVRSGPDAGWRQRLRLVAGTGFCGAFTTYSTLAVESVQLARHGAWGTGAIYVAVSLVGGVLAAGLGVAAGAARARRR